MNVGLLYNIYSNHCSTRNMNICLLCVIRGILCVCVYRIMCAHRYSHLAKERGAWAELSSYSPNWTFNGNKRICEIPFYTKDGTFIYIMPFL